MLKYIYIFLIIVSGFAIMAFSSDIDQRLVRFEENETSFYEPIVVLELFTSQGCSSCPSADLLLQKVKKQYPDEVFALSYHVDYWNYIGWNDPFSNSKFAEKQRKYNIKFRNRTNYTPQMVVNGKEHFVASNASKMEDRIKSYKVEKAQNQINISALNVNVNKVSFRYEINGKVKGVALRTLLVIDHRSTEVKRGENRNRTLQNSNVVVAEESTSITNASGLSEIAIPSIVRNNDQLNLIVLAEDVDYNITGATKYRLVR